MTAAKSGPAWPERPRSLEEQLRLSLCVVPSEGFMKLDGACVFIPSDYALDEVQRELEKVISK